jgi:hypothetical protein
MIDLTPEDRKSCEDANDDSVLPTDWLERTAELHPSLDRTFGPKTWRRLAMGDIMTQYGSFYNNAESQFGNWRFQTTLAHERETDEKVKSLQAINAKCSLPPNTGVDQLKKERREEFKAYFADLLTRFKAKSSRWTTRNHE